MWDKSTFTTLHDSIFFHANKHGKRVHGKPFYTTYLRQSSNFINKGAHKTFNYLDGTTKWEKGNGEFIIRNTQTGKIVTYGWNYD